MNEFYPPNFDITPYFSMFLLFFGFVVKKLNQQTKVEIKTYKPESVYKSTAIDFLPEIVLKNITAQGVVNWEIQVHNIGSNPIKVIRARAVGSCLLLDKSKYIFSSKDNLIETDEPMSFANTLRIDFKHRFNPEFLPHKIRLGCSFDIQNQEGNIERHFIPLLYSRSILFTRGYDEKALEDKLTEEIYPIRPDYAI